MSRKRSSAEEIVNKLRQAEVEWANGKTVSWCASKSALRTRPEWHSHKKQP